MKKFLLALFVATAALGACKKASTEDCKPDMGYDYFPQDSGRTWIYQCDSIVFNDFTSTIDTFRFEVQERITYSFQDNENRKNWVVEQSTRRNDSFPWSQPRIIATCRTDAQAERFENNTRYVKFVFPPKDGREWNGNAMNNKLEERYTMANFRKPYEVLGKTYENSITVEQVNDSNFIELNIAREVYAPDAGLIFKQQDYTFNQNGKVSGLKYRLYLKEYAR